MLITLLVFLLILSILVLIHEAGHYFVAKWLNIKVEEFGYGLPPRAWGKKIGETLYSINWLPIGGFVKLYGEDEAGGGSVKLSKSELPKKNLDRAFFNRPVGQRAAVVVAGVVMNVVLAVLIYYLFLGMSNFKAELPLLGDHRFFFVNQEDKRNIIIRDISRNSPAEKAGVKPLTRVLAVNGEPVSNMEAFVEAINSNRGKAMVFEWQDLQTNEKFKATITPRVNPPENEGSLGVSFFPVETAVLTYDTPIQKTFSGFIHPANLMVYNFSVIGDLIGTSVREKDATPLGDAVAGPVGIFNVVGEFINIPDAKERFLQILNLAGLLSISLAFFNILPIPALDGGRLFFILIEGITGRKVNQRFETIAHTVGMAVLLTLILLITFKDIFQLFR